MIILGILLLFPRLSMGQTAINEETLKKIIELYRDGQTDKVISIIDSLRKSNVIKDKNYTILILASADINKKTYNLEGSIRDNEELITLSPESEINRQVQIGILKKYIGDFDGSIKAYERIIKLDPKNNIAYNNMASTYIAAEKYQDALSILNNKNNLDKGNLEFFISAIAYFHLNRLDSAKYNIDKYIELEDVTNDFEAYKYAAQIYFALDENKKSCDLITKANEIIINTKTEEQISKQSQKVQEYFICQKSIKNIKETKKLKGQLCL